MFVDFQSLLLLNRFLITQELIQASFSVSQRVLSTFICANAKVKWIGQLCVSSSMSLIYFAFTPCFFFLILLCKHYFFNVFQYSNHYFVLGSKAGRLLVQKHSSEQTNVTSLNNLQVQCSFYSLNAPKKKQILIDLRKKKENF